MTHQSIVTMASKRAVVPSRRDAAVTSRIMAAIPSRDTKAEVVLRKALHSRGFRYRVHSRAILGRPDIAFVSRRVAVFVDGDFWHGNTWRLRGATSLRAQFGRWRNSDFWISKIRGNMARDRAVNRALRREGWTVIRVWESAIARDLDSCIARVVAACSGRRPR